MEKPGGREKISGVVLAGGQSRRFGRDKGLYVYKNKPLALHAAEILEPLCDEIIISSNKPAEYAPLGFRVISDIYKNCGPLGGIHSGLSHAAHDKVAFIACDTPHIPASIYSFLLQHQQSYDAIMPAHGQYIETLCAVYHKGSLVQITASLENKTYKILDAHKDLMVRYISVEAEDFYSPEIFHNINYQDDI